jgi:hypothetical protein
MVEHQLTMHVLGDLQSAQHRKMLQKCMRLSARTTGERFKTFATLFDCRGHASTFCRQIQHEADCCKIHAKAADNQKQHWLEVSMELKEQVRNDLYVLSKVMIKVGFMGTTLKQNSNHLCGSVHLHPGQRKSGK